MKAILVAIVLIVAVVFLAGFVTAFRDVATSGPQDITVELAGEPVWTFDWPIQ